MAKDCLAQKVIYSLEKIIYFIKMLNQWKHPWPSCFKSRIQSPCSICILDYLNIYWLYSFTFYDHIYMQQSQHANYIIIITAVYQEILFLLYMCYWSIWTWLYIYIIYSRIYVDIPYCTSKYFNIVYFYICIYIHIYYEWICVCRNISRFFSWIHSNFQQLVNP